MRISTSQLNDIMLGSMQNSTTGVNKAFIQLNSGERMLKPSDDPLGSVQLMLLDREQASLNQYQSNIKSLETQLGKTESHLDSAHTAMLRAEELLASVNNASNSTPAGRDAIATELENILGQLVDIANSQNPNGDYVFSGTKTDTKPIERDAATGEFIYQGNSEQREVRVSESMTIPANETADSIFFSGGSDVFNSLDKAVKSLRDPAVSGDSLTNAVNRAQSNVDDVTRKVNNTWTDVGGHRNAMSMLDGAHKDNALLNEKLISGVKDLDYSQAILDLNTQMSALQATQMTYSKIQNLSLFKHL